MEYKIVILLLTNNLYLVLSQTATLRNNEYSCVNPNQQTRLCLSLYYCPTFLNISSGSAEEQRFFQESQCSNGFGPAPHVCCSENLEFIGSQNNNNLLATPEDCTARYSEYRYGGGIADIRDYHWLAVIGEKNESGNFQRQCTGFLISHRYVLTAGHCALHFNSKNKTIIVRLGEYDLNTAIDCQDGLCLNPVIDVVVENAIIHEHFLIRPRRNNIALLRLTKEIPYNEDISPICLPSVVGLNASSPGEGLFVAGWGTPGYLSPEVNNRKLEANLPIFDQENCKTIYAEQRSEISDFELCAGGGDESVCSGDSGTPLMKKFKHKWVAEGMTSYGSRCGMRDVPSVFVRISKYEDWIKDNMEP